MAAPGWTWHLIKFVWCECWMHLKCGSRPPLQSLLLTVLDVSEFSPNINTTHTHAYTQIHFFPPENISFQHTLITITTTLPRLNCQISATSFKSFSFSLFFSIHTLQNCSTITVRDFRCLLLCRYRNVSWSTDVCAFKKSPSFLNEATFEYIEHQKMKLNITFL